MSAALKDDDGAHSGLLRFMGRSTVGARELGTEVLQLGPEPELPKLESAAGNGSSAGEEGGPLLLAGTHRLEPKGQERDGLTAEQQQEDQGPGAEDVESDWDDKDITNTTAANPTVRAEPKTRSLDVSAATRVWVSFCGAGLSLTGTRTSWACIQELQCASRTHCPPRVVGGFEPFSTSRHHQVEAVSTVFHDLRIGE